MFHVHAPAGLGKSALLSELVARHPRARYVDARDLDATPEAVERSLGSALRRQGALLLLDTVELLAPLDGWLRETFIPRLPTRSVLVLAGRKPPSVAWHALPGWGTLLCELRLGPLGDEDARALLARRGVPPERMRELIKFTRGYPLALCLAADAVAANPRLSLASGPPPDLVRALLAHVVARAPSDEHRAALEAASVVRALTEPLLAALLDERNVHDRFDWLAQLSFVNMGTNGLFPHDLVRDLIDADLRWRDRQRHETLVQRASTYYLGLMKRAADPERARSVLDWLFLHRHSPIFGGAIDWETTESQRVELAQPSDEPAIRALVTRHEGPESAALIARWLGRPGTSCKIFRDENPVPAGFFLEVWLDQADRADAEFDPGTREALRIIERRGPLRPGERAVMLRSWMSRDHYDMPSPVHAWLVGSGIRTFATTRSLCYSLEAVSSPEYWTESLEYAGNERTTDFEVGGRRYATFLLDFRARNLWALMEAILRSADPAARPPLPKVVSLLRPAFARAVRAALKRLNDHMGLSASPLIDARLVWVRVGPDADRAARTRALASLIAEAIAGLGNTPRSKRAERALHRTYVDPVPVQKQAAADLGLPWATYRSHLTLGLNMLIESLWRGETDT